MSAGAWGVKLLLIWRWGCKDLFLGWLLGCGGLHRTLGGVGNCLGDEDWIAVLHFPAAAKEKERL